MEFVGFEINNSQHDIVMIIEVLLTYRLDHNVSAEFCFLAKI